MGLGLRFNQRAGCGVCVVIAAGAIVATSLFGVAETGPRPVVSARAKRGAAIFQQNCANCHNKRPDDTAPFGPPNLHGIFSKKPLVKPISPLQAAVVIKKGMAPMPGFGNTLTDAQINDLIAYLKAQ